MEKNKRQKFFVSAGLILLNAFLWTWFYGQGIFGGWQLALQDRIYSTTNRAAPEVILVAIDDASLADPVLGRWQDWRRGFFATALRNLQSAGAAVIGLDVIFSEAATSADDALLTETLNLNPNLVLAAQKNVDSDLLPLSEFRAAADFGFTNLAADQVDGVVRRVPIFSGKIANFDLVLLEKFFGTTSQSLTPNRLVFSQSKLRSPFALQKTYGPIVAPLENGSLLINFFGRPGSFARISFTDIFHNNFNPDLVRGKIVLLGFTDATGIHDEQLTPVSAGQAMSGVEIHANILQTLLSGQTLQNLNQSGAVVLLGATLIIFGILFFTLPLVTSLILFGLGILAELLGAIFAFENGILLPFAFLLWGTLAILVVALIYHYFGKGAELRYLQKAFSRYLAPELVRKIEDDPRALGLGGAKRELTIFFADLENFTKISEKMSPSAVVRMLDERLGAITKTVLAAGGTLDKFIGDAVMAFWNAPLPNPDHALAACRAALATKKILADKVPKARTGIHTGPAVVGNLGLATRFNYTAIGDAVNVASRLEGVNKIYGTQILISGETFQKVQKELLARLIDRVVVKGRREFTEIYELLAEKKSATAAQISLAEKSLKAFSAYRKRDFKTAVQIYRTIHHPASAVMLARITRFRKNPPPVNWRGETILKIK
ncbi:MAG: CHASE2 domain-containing protein [Patescibacteria group bacterium]